MKILKFLFLATFISFFFACSSDDNAEPNNMIAGEWTVSEISYSGTTSTVVQGNPPSSGTFVGTGFDMDLKIDFEENPNNYTSSGDYSINLETTVDGQTYPSVWSNIEFQGSGTWSRSGDVLTFTNENGDTSDAQIIEENESMLKFTQTYNNTENQNGATVTHQVDAIFSFTK